MARIGRFPSSCWQLQHMWRNGRKSNTAAPDDANLRANAAFETQYKDVVRYHFGVEYLVPTIALDLRAGFYTDPLPFVGPRDLDRLPDERFNPLVVAVEDRSYWTLGAGLMFEEVMRIDLAWNRGTFERKEGPLGRGDYRQQGFHRTLIRILSS